MCSEMALLKYLNKDGLSNLRGSLSAEVPLRVIAQANAGGAASTTS